MGSRRSLFVALCLVLATGPRDAWTARILIYNPQHEFAQSHRHFMGNLADLLASDGHEVTMYQPQSDHDITPTGSKDARVKVLHWKTNTTQHLEYSHLQRQVWTATGTGTEFGNVMGTIARVFNESCNNQVQNADLIRTLKEGNFDLGIAELFDACGFPLFEMIGLRKRITIFTCTMYDIVPGYIGLPNSQSGVPSQMLDFSPRMNFLQRFTNVLAHLHSEYLLWWGAARNMWLEEAYWLGPRLRTNAVQESVKSSYIFINSEEHFDIPRPISHKIVYVGGFNFQNANGTLNEYFGKVVHEAKKGVFIVSFGSVTKASQMPIKLRQEMLAAFAKFPEITFVWKHDLLDRVRDPNTTNVLYSRWLPQKELLAHPKCLGILTHGGQNSVIEIAHAGVPAIAVPLFVDQYKNVAQLTFRGTGVVLQRSKVTCENLANALHTVLNEPELGANARNLARLIASKPLSARDRVLRYVNFTVQFGDQDLLELEAGHLALLQFYNLDVWTVLVTMCLAALAGTTFLFLRTVHTLSFCVSKKSKQE